MENDSNAAAGKKLDDSWLLIKNINAEEEDAGKSPETNHNKNIICLKSTEEMEDSDGISVISESEIYKNNFNPSDGEAEKSNSLPEDEGETEEDEDEASTDSQKSVDTTVQKSTVSKVNDDLLIKPKDAALKPSNQKTENKEKIRFLSPAEQREKSIDMYMVLIAICIGSLFFMTLVHSYVIIFMNKRLENRVIQLELDNLNLKSQLDKLLQQKHDSIESNIQEPLTSDTPSENLQEEILNKNYLHDQQPIVKEPPTKKVWLGGEREEVVKIIDKKYNSLPDYCFNTDEDDLFYEYNKENCERKKVKLEQKQTKPKLSDEDIIWQFEEQQIKNFVKYGLDPDPYPDLEKMRNQEKIKGKETTNDILMSLNEEIQEIKKSRYHSGNDETDKYSQTKEKFKNLENRRRDGKHDNGNSSDETRDKNKKKNKRQQKQKGENSKASAWDEQRSAAREAARHNHETGSQENWYIKRKNDREIHRLGIMQ